MSNNRILFLVTSLNCGGIENYLLRYLKFDSGMQPYVLCKSGKGGQLECEYITVLGMDHIVKKKMNINPFSWIDFFLFIKRNDINVVCDFTGEMSGLVMLISKLAKVNIRLTFYRHASIHFKNTTFRMLYFHWMLFLIRKYSTKILSNSQAAFNFFHPEWRFFPSKFEVIYNGISKDFVDTNFSCKELRERLNIPLDAFVVGHIGRVNSAKNHVTILEVAQSVCREDLNVHFILAGNGTEDLQVHDFKDRIHLLGFRSDVGRLLSSIDLFYFPSLTEGQPNSLIEAMVKDVAIIASNIEPIRETVPRCMVDKLIPPMDIQKATEQIFRAVRDKEYLESLKFKKWAIEHFDAAKLFGKFKKELG